MVDVTLRAVKLSRAGCQIVHTAGGPTRKVTLTLNGGTVAQLVAGETRAFWTGWVCSLLKWISDGVFRDEYLRRWRRREGGGGRVRTGKQVLYARQGGPGIRRCS